MSRSQAFLGAMILDLSNRTDNQVVADFLNVLITPFNNIYCSDILYTPIFDNRLVETTDITSGLLVVGSTELPDTRKIPSKAAQVYSWLTGTVTNMTEINEFYGKDESVNYQSGPSKMLLRLNSYKHKEEYTTYNPRVQGLVTNKIKGQFCSQLMYLGPKPLISLISKGLMLYFSVVTVDTATVLVWSSEMDTVQTLLSAIPQNHQLSYLKKEAWVNNLAILTEDKSTVTINPKFLLSKFRKWGVDNRFQRHKTIISLENYLHRSAI